MGQRVVENDTLERLAQAGLVGRALFYAVLALLAAQVVIGGGGGAENANAQGAIQAIAEQPFGKVLLIALAAAFGAYAMWRAVQAYRGPREEPDLPEWFVRAGFASRAVLYSGLAVLALRPVLSGGGSGGNSERTMTQKLLEMTGGQWIVGLVGLVVLGVAAYQAYHAVTRSFLEDLDERDIDENTRTWLEPLGSAGHAGRALAFGLVGAFILQAAVSFESGGVGLDGALGELSGTGYGPFLIGAVALGFALYGGYLVAMARYAELRDLD